MPSIIPINSKYCIRLDNHSWSVCYWRPRNNHKDGGAWEGISWHGTLLHAMEWLVKRLVSESDLEGTEEVINALSLSTLLITTAIHDSCIPNSWTDAKEITRSTIHDV